MQDKGVAQTNLGEILNSQLIKEEAPTSTRNVTFNLENLSECLRMAKELFDLLMNIRLWNKVLFLRGKLQMRLLYYIQTEIKELLKTAKQEKITKFVKPLPNL